MTENEKYLLERIKENDQFAFKAIHTKYFSRLYYFVLAFIPLDDIAENIVQDTFLTLWNRRSELKENTNLGAYLFTVAKNNCLSQLRYRRLRQIERSSDLMDEMELALNMEVLDSIESSDFVVEDIERIIGKTLAELPPKCRKVFMLSRFEEKKNREIAEELNISVKVVEKHISKGLKAFRVALKDYLPLVAYLIDPF